MGRLVAPEEFWIELRAGVSVATASQAAGVSYFTGYRWLAEAGGPDALGLEPSRVGVRGVEPRARRFVMCSGPGCGGAPRSPRPLGLPAWRGRPGRPG